ncbi:MAG: hypothetical protein ABIL76_00115 [candidate division WOR-3 bacterium]
MKILNLVKDLKIEQYELAKSITDIPDIVIIPNNHKKLYELSLNYLTITIGKTNFKSVDWSFENKDEIKNFLNDYSKKTIRQRISDFYNKFYNLDSLKPANVKFVCYYGQTMETYEKLETLLKSPYNPWILIYGQRGVGKLTIIRSILENAIDYFEIEEKHAGFKTDNKKTEKSIIILNIDLFENEYDLNFAINEIYKRGQRIIFITDKISPPQNLLTIPSIYIPSISERNNKEKLLILEHFLRKISNDFIEIEDNFYKAFLTYPWFGNFSEIENAIKYALSLDNKVLKFENLPKHITEQFDENYNLKIADYYLKLMVLNFKNIDYEQLKFLIGSGFASIIQFLYELTNKDFNQLLEILKVNKKSEIDEIKSFLDIPSNQK